VSSFALAPPTLPAPFALAMYNASYGTVPVHVACLLLLPSTVYRLPSTVYSPRLLSFNTMFLVSNSYIACGKTCACSSKSTIHGANIMSDTIRPSSSERKRRRVDKSQCTSTSKRTGSELSGLSPFPFEALSSALDDLTTTANVEVRTFLIDV
jgi:hypothetical protein